MNSRLQTIKNVDYLRPELARILVLLIRNYFSAERIGTLSFVLFVSVSLFYPSVICLSFSFWFAQYLGVRYCRIDIITRYDAVERVSVAAVRYTPILEVLGSNLGQETGYPVFYRFLQSLQTNFRIVPGLGHDSFLPNPFQFIIFQSSRYWRRRKDLGTYIYIYIYIYRSEVMVRR
jgi:hypothetical protein